VASGLWGRVGPLGLQPPRGVPRAAVAVAPQGLQLEARQDLQADRLACARAARHVQHQAAAHLGNKGLKGEKDIERDREEIETERWRERERERERWDGQQWTKEDNELSAAHTFLVLAMVRYVTASVRFVANCNWPKEGQRAKINTRNRNTVRSLVTSGHGSVRGSSHCASSSLCEWSLRGSGHCATSGHVAASIQIIYNIMSQAATWLQQGIHHHLLYSTQFSP